jgi:cytochrome c peroxidase
MNYLKYTLIIALAIYGVNFFPKVYSSYNVLDTKQFEFNVPEGWPQPFFNFKETPLDSNIIRLGRVLFYDPNLSRNSQVSCATCHLVYTGFTHIDHDLSHGIEDRIGNRNTTAIINPAWKKSFMWDGAANHITVQPLGPLTNPNEMDQSLDTLMNRLRNNPSYQSQYSMAFKNDSAVTLKNTMLALSQFMLTFTSSNSKYDKVMRKEEGEQFTPRELEGYKVFKKNCDVCHTEPLFTNNKFMSNGLNIDSTLQDKGRQTITANPKDSLLFMVPTLRNIEATYPYMHDGRFKKLQMVIHHYTNADKEPHNLSEHLKSPINLSTSEKRNLIQFLKTLTDTEFLYNSDLSFPRSEY